LDLSRSRWKLENKRHKQVSSLSDTKPAVQPMVRARRTAIVLRAQASAASQFEAIPDPSDHKLYAARKSLWANELLSDASNSGECDNRNRVVARPIGNCYSPESSVSRDLSGIQSRFPRP